MYNNHSKTNYQKIRSKSSIVFISISLALMILYSKSSIAQSTSEIDFLYENIGLLNFEANVAFDKKEYREASKKFIMILKHKPNDIQTLYNLASCYSYLNKPELAAKVLQYAIDAGMNDISLILTDSVWNPIKDHKLFQPILEQARKVIKEQGDPFYCESRIIIKGRIRKPDNYDSTKKYPLLIILHGNGANPESYMYLRDEMGASNFFVAAPQGPYTRKVLDVNGPSYSWFYLTRDKSLWERSDPMTIEYIINVINEIKSHYNISAVYLLGHSQGGALAYLTGIRNPDLIKGILCFGAGNPKELIRHEEFINAASKLHIFIGHGWSDQAVPFDEAQQAKTLLTQYGFDLTFKPFQGGHRMQISALIEARKWIENLESKNL